MQVAMDVAATLSEPGWQDIQAVAITAETRFEDRDSGFAEVWRKPLDVRRVLTRLYDVLYLRDDDEQPQIEPPRARAAFAAPLR